MPAGGWGRTGGRAVGMVGAVVAGAGNAAAACWSTTGSTLSQPAHSPTAPCRHTLTVHCSLFTARRTLLQEIKLQADHCEAVLKELGLPGWHVTWNCSKDKKGGSGWGCLWRGAVQAAQHVVSTAGVAVFLCVVWGGSGGGSDDRHERVVLLASAYQPITALLLSLQATAAQPSCPRTSRCRSAAASATPSTMGR